ncbi:MAG: hypothetical protein HC819_01655 [Cyclobacteriaceae bacterium]|nr:hypothetical protein [Cyclobacteriaceae bacterium]
MKNTKTIHVHLLVLSMLLASCTKDQTPVKVILTPGTDLVVTTNVQHAIDSCEQSGGGTVYFPKGKYVTGGLHMKSNVTLEFEEGALLEGSSNLEDYGEWKWTNAVIMGEGLKNIRIIGKGLLDGIDLKNPAGEAGFRGPHFIRFTNCDSIEIRDITITRSANWAMNFRHCSNGAVVNVKVRGGHDALHTRWCNDFYVEGCDFRTGDDCFAGNDNQNFLIENCKVNSSCNGFRFGGQNIVIRNVHIWGPGEFKHIIQNRYNTLSAFTHFSPKDENPKSVSGNWLLEDIVIEGVDNAFNYNFKDGLWQTGQPATDMVFKNLTVRNVKKAFNILGDSARQFSLVIRHAILDERDTTSFTQMHFEGREVEVPAFFNIRNFDHLVLDSVIFHVNGDTPKLYARDGNELEIKNRSTNGGGSTSVNYDIANVERVALK